MSFATGNSSFRTTPLFPLWKATARDGAQIRRQGRNQPHQRDPLRLQDVRFMCWKEVSAIIEDAIARTIQQKKVTYDLERLMEGATKLKTSQYATAIIENMQPQPVAA